MKIQNHLSIFLLVVSLSAASAAEAAKSPARASESAQSSSGLTSFDLDFPGGTPRELVAAIRKASGIPLNAIVPDEFANTQLPGLKMKDVNVPQLFQALEAASRKTAVYTTSAYSGGAQGGYKSYNSMTTSYGFKTEGPQKDDSIWYFFVTKPNLPPGSSLETSGKVCRFYGLTPYLTNGLTVDDITTAISTGWKMLGETSPAEINFHKETKLLIAVGEPRALEIIDSALKALEGRKTHTPAASSAAPEKAAEKTKPDE